MSLFAIINIFGFCNIQNYNLLQKMIADDNSNTNNNNDDDDDPNDDGSMLLPTKT